MLKRTALVLVGILVFSSLCNAQSAALAQEILKSKAATTQPAQQTIIVTQAPAGQATPTLSQVLMGTRLGKLAQGEQVALEDLRDPAFWIDTVKDLVVALIGFIPRLIVALLFLLVFWVIYRAVRRVLVGSMKRANIDPSIRDMLGYLVKWAIMGFGIVIACNQIGIQIAALLTGVSIIGLAIGFAAQETLSNFIAGIVIFWDKPFRLGDWVEIDGVYAQVQRVTFRSTRMLDLNGDAVIVPNTMMLSRKLSNRSIHPATRVTVSIGIAYKDSIAQARAVLLPLVRGDQRVLPAPEPVVQVDACSDNSVHLVMRFWVEDEAVALRIRHEYLEKAKNALDTAGISIPLPLKKAG